MAPLVDRRRRRDVLLNCLGWSVCSNLLDARTIGRPWLALIGDRISPFKHQDADPSIDPRLLLRAVLTSYRRVRDPQGHDPIKDNVQRKRGWSDWTSPFQFGGSISALMGRTERQLTGHYRQTSRPESLASQIDSRREFGYSGSSSKLRPGRRR